MEKSDLLPLSSASLTLGTGVRVYMYRRGGETGLPPAYTYPIRFLRRRDPAVSACCPRFRQFLHFFHG